MVVYHPLENLPEDEKIPALYCVGMLGNEWVGAGQGNWPIGHTGS